MFSRSGTLNIISVTLVFFLVGISRVSHHLHHSEAGRGHCQVFPAKDHFYTLYIDMSLQCGKLI